MTEGISKETIENHIDRLYRCNGYHDREVELSFCYTLLSECTELDPWMPIDENTPKDCKTLLLKLGTFRCVGCWSKDHNSWLDHCFRPFTPTHYKLLPK